MVDAKDAMKGSWFSSLDVIEKFIDPDADKVEPLETREEGVEYPLKRREEY